MSLTQLRKLSSIPKGIARLLLVPAFIIAFDVLPLFAAQDNGSQQSQQPQSTQQQQNQQNSTPSAGGPQGDIGPIAVPKKH